MESTFPFHLTQALPTAPASRDRAGISLILCYLLQGFLLLLSHSPAAGSLKGESALSSPLTGSSAAEGGLPYLMEAFRRTGHPGHHVEQVQGAWPAFLLSLQVESRPEPGVCCPAPAPPAGTRWGSQHDPFYGGTAGRGGRTSHLASGPGSALGAQTKGISC